jgi:phosphate transport system ATP-binding protein
MTADALKIRMEAKDLDFYYGGKKALDKVNIACYENRVTAIIGPSGCGKSTFIRTLNRMNDVIAGTRVEGTILLDGRDIRSPDVDVVDLRRRVGMVFQKPNPFPKSIFDNIAYGLRINGMRDKKKLEAVVEASLRGAALWDEVKDRLDENAFSSLGRAAAAAVHRQGLGRRARGHPVRRAVLGHRSHRHGQDRGLD